MGSLRQPDDFIRRLLDDPYDASALREAFAAASGEADAYAGLLERAAAVVPDDPTASHLLTEAALAHLRASPDAGGAQGISLLRRALERDPLNARAATTLSTYRVRTDPETFATILAERARALEDLASEDPALLLVAADAYETLSLHQADVLERADLAVSSLQKALSLARRRAKLAEVSAGRPADTVAPARRGGSRIRRARESVFVPQGTARPSVWAEDEQPTNPESASIPAETPATDPGSLPPSERLSTTSLRPPEGVMTNRGANASADDRLMGLFEALHAVRFCRDVREGAAIVVRIVRDALGASTAILHLYDANAREYVVTAAEGLGQGRLVGMRCPEEDPLIAQANRANAAVLLEPHGQLGSLSGDRWSVIEPRLSVVCAPVLDGEGPLGAIEIVDPTGRSSFDAHDCDAMTYAGERFAEFLAERGLPLD